MTTVAPACIHVGSPASEASVTVDHLLDAPLPELLAEFDVELREYPPTDLPPCGYAVVRGGRIGLRMPAGQSWKVRDMMARSMLGQALRVPMPPLPAPYRLSEMSAAL